VLRTYSGAPHAHIGLDTLAVTKPTSSNHRITTQNLLITKVPTHEVLSRLYFASWCDVADRQPREITLRCRAAATIRHTAEWLTSNSGSSVSDNSSSASSGTSRRLWAIILSRSAIEFKSLVFLPRQCTSNHQPSHIKKLCYHRRAVRCAMPVEISSTAAQLYKNCILKSAIDAWT